MEKLKNPGVGKITTERDERVKILINISISKVVRIESKVLCIKGELVL